MGIRSYVTGVRTRCYNVGVVSSPTSPATPPDPPNAAQWTFLTNHAHVLVCIAQDPNIRIADIARLVGIGERAAHRIVHDLIEADYVRATRVGRRNAYEVCLDRPMRHPLESNHRLAEVFGPLSQ